MKTYSIGRKSAVDGIGQMFIRMQDGGEFLLGNKGAMLGEITGLFAFDEYDGVCEFIETGRIEAVTLKD